MYVCLMSSQTKTFINDIECVLDGSCRNKIGINQIQQQTHHPTKPKKNGHSIRFMSPWPEHSHNCLMSHHLKFSQYIEQYLMTGATKPPKCLKFTFKDNISVTLITALVWKDCWDRGVPPAAADGNLWNVVCTVVLYLYDYVGHHLNHTWMHSAMFGVRNYI